MFKPSSSTAVLAARIVLLLIAATSVVVAFVVTRDGVPGSSEAAGAYVCPMHPEVTASAPGDCSICKMALEPAKTARAAETPAPSEPASAGKPPKKYVCPMHPQVTSPKPGSCPICKMDSSPRRRNRKQRRPQVSMNPSRPPCR